MDWATLAALITAGAAIVTAFILVWQTRVTTRAQTIMQLLSAWGSPPLFPRMRNTAALALLNYLHRQDLLRKESDAGMVVESVTLDNTSHVDEILDFFETISFFTKKRWLDPSRILDEKLTYHAFFWPMVNYWVVTREYIFDTQKDGAPHAWEEFSILMPRLVTREGWEPTINESREFLEEEIARSQ